MRKTALLVAAAALLGAGAVTVPPAAAQTFEVGPGGVGVDLRSPRQRERDYDRAQMREEERRDRRRARYDDDSTGSIGCREVTVRERNEYGEMETRTRRTCR